MPVAQATEHEGADVPPMPRTDGAEPEPEPEPTVDSEGRAFMCAKINPVAKYSMKPHTHALFLVAHC
jgi:hypothetical protein